MDQERLSDLTLFNSIDAGRMSEQMGLVAKGKTRGAANTPAESATLPDDVETQIIHKVHELRSEVVQDSQLRLQTLNRLMSKTRASVGVSVLENEVTPIVTGLEQNAQVDVIDLDYTQEKLEQQKQDFNAWRKSRRLDRPAEESKSPLSFFADLFLLAIVEGALNLFFFTENNALGMLGAFAQAFIIAGVNILLCVVIGFVLFKRVNSIFILQKALGVVSIAAFMVALPAAHLVIGFYRIARQGQADAGEHILETPPDAAAIDIESTKIMMAGPEINGASQLWTAVDWALAGDIYRLDEMSIIMCVIGVIFGGVFCA